jgi:hypothetical protein
MCFLPLSLLMVRGKKKFLCCTLSNWFRKMLNEKCGLEAAWKIERQVLKLLRGDETVNHREDRQALLESEVILTVAGVDLQWNADQLFFVDPRLNVNW